MKIKLTKTFAGIAVAATAIGLVLAGGGAASAVGTPTPWVGTDPNELGGLAFYNSAGVAITGGNLTDAPLAAYVEGTTVIAPSNVKATVFGYLPNSGLAPGAWSGEGLSASTTYPVTAAAAPASIKSKTTPVESGQAADLTLGNLVQDFPNTSTTAGYSGMYELRLKTSGGTAGTQVKYDYADIKVQNVTTDTTGAVTGGTWTVVYTPDAPVVTSTTLTANPSPSTVGQSVTLTATETPAIAGSVQFEDGTTAIGAPVAVSGAGVATATTATLTQGTHSLSAIFTPTSSANTGSTGTATLVVNPPATATTTALAVGGANTTAGSDATLTATVSPSAAPGSVAFYDNGQTTALPGTVTSPSAGVYFLDLPTGFTAGGHSVVAKFTPTDVTVYQVSQSQPQNFTTSNPVVGACLQTGSVCIDVQNVQATIPVGTLVINTPYTAAAPLDLGNLVLQTGATEFKGTATFSNIKVTDTRAGNLPWTVQGLSSNLTDGGTHTGSVINSQNVGLTQLTGGAGSGGFAGVVTATDNPAADPAVGPSAPLGAAGQQGLGINPHTIISADHGQGTYSINGVLTITAPTSTEAGVFTGTVTFTVG